MAVRARPAVCCRPRAVRPLPARRQQDLIAALKALADPTRLEILRLIAAQPAPLCVCDIVDRFELGQPTISHHLKVLRRAGLVETGRQGIWSFYKLGARTREILAGVTSLVDGREGELTPDSTERS